MSEWHYRRLGDVVELRRGFDLPARLRVGGPFPVLSAGATAGWHDQGPVKGPGFVIGRATNLGQPTWSDIDFWPLNTTLYAADFKGNSPRFLFHLFEFTDLAGFDSGSVQPMLNRNYIADVPVLIPSLSTQCAIAEVLGALDDKIAANERVVVVGEQLVQELVGRVGDRVALEELATRSKQSTKPDPAEHVTHFSLPAFDDGQSPSSERGEDIKSSKFLLNSPCVLMSKLNPRISRVWNVSELPEGTCIASTEFVVLVPQVVSTHALWATLTHPRVRDELMGRVAGTSGSHQRVKPEEILALDVTDVRSLSDTSRDQVDAVGALGHQLRVESRTLAQTRDQLLPLLMSGKVTIKEAENEIADLV